MEELYGCELHLKKKLLNNSFFKNTGSWFSHALLNLLCSPSHSFRGPKTTLRKMSTILKPEALNPKLQLCLDFKAYSIMPRNKQLFPITPSVPIFLIRQHNSNMCILKQTCTYYAAEGKICILEKAIFTHSLKQFLACGWLFPEILETGWEAHASYHYGREA